MNCAPNCLVTVTCPTSLYPVKLVCNALHCLARHAGEVDTSESSKNTLRAAIPGIAVGAVVTVLLIVFISLLLIIACTWRGQRRKKITLQSSSSSYASRSSSKDSLNFPEVATPDLCRKSPGGMEMKPLEFKNIISEDDEDLIPSGAIPVGLFREHVDKFDENRQLLFQHEFDVSDVIVTSYFIQ